MKLFEVRKGYRNCISTVLIDDVISIVINYIMPPKPTPREIGLHGIFDLTSENLDDTIQGAAESRYSEMLDMLDPNGSKSHCAALGAAISNDVNTLDIILSKCGRNVQKYEFLIKNIMIGAGRGGHIELIERFRNMSGARDNLEYCFIATVESGKIDVIKYMCGIMPSLIDTPHTAAVAYGTGSVEIVKFLRHEKRPWMLKHAIKGKSMELVKMCLSNNSAPYDHINDAFESNSVDIATLLIQYGAIPTERCLFHACYHANEELIAIALSHKVPVQSGLLGALSNGHKKIANRMIAMGAVLERDASFWVGYNNYIDMIGNISEKYMISCLKGACQAGNIDLVKYILYNNTELDVNKIKEDIMYLDDMEIASMLIRRGIDMYEYLKYVAPLHRYSIMKYLLDEGANPHIGTKYVVDEKTQLINDYVEPDYILYSIGDIGPESHNLARLAISRGADGGAFMVMQRHRSGMDFLVSQGVSPYFAIEANHEWMLEHGIDPDIIMEMEPEFNTCKKLIEKYGVDPSRAMRYIHELPELTPYLISKGVDMSNMSIPPIIYLLNNEVDNISELIEKCSDINRVAVVYLESEYRTNNILLLDHGADYKLFLGRRDRKVIEWLLEKNYISPNYALLEGARHGYMSTINMAIDKGATSLYTAYSIIPFTERRAPEKLYNRICERYPHVRNTEKKYIRESESESEIESEGESDDE